MSAQQKMHLGWMVTLNSFKEKNSTLLTKQKASIADRDQYIPDGLSPTGSVSSVCISGRRRCDAAPDGEGGTLFP